MFVVDLFEVVVVGDDCFFGVFVDEGDVGVLCVDFDFFVVYVVLDENLDLFWWE